MSLVGSQAAALPTDDSEAEGRLISGGGVVNLNTIAALEPAYSADPSASGDVSNPLSVEVLEALNIDLGDGIQLFGENGILALGALGQYASTSEGEVPFASSGAINADGSIAVGTGDPAENAYIDLGPLLGQAGLDDLLTQARVELGAITATATYDAEGQPAGDYQIADATLILQSDVLGGLTGELTSALGPVSDSVNGLVGADGVVNATLQPLLSLVQDTVNTVLLGLGSVNDLGVAASLDVDLEAAVQSVLAEPITSPDSAVTIDLSTGEISVDLARLVADTQGGVYDGTLNNLPPNTEVLGPDVIQAALDGAIGSTLDQIPALVVNAVTDALNSAELAITITGEAVGLPPLNLPIGNLQINIAGALGDFIGVEGSTPPVVDLAGTSIIGLELGSLLTPILGLATGTLLPALVGPISDAITDEGTLDTIFRPIVQGVNDLLSPVAELITNNLISLTANVQELPGDFTTPTAEDAGSFTQRALKLTLLPVLAEPLAEISLASATVRATPLAATLTVEPDPVEIGGELTTVGEGFLPNTEVTVEYVDAGGNLVWTSTVTTDENGGFTDTIVVPEETELGEMTVTASDGTNDAEGTTEVIEGTGTDPEGTDPEGTDPEGTDPDGTDPEGTDPEGTDPEGTDPDGTDPEGTDPEGTDPDGTDPEGTDPEGTDPEGTDPDGTDPDGTDPEGTDPEGTDPEGTDPEGTDPEGTDPEGTDPEGTDPEGTDPEGTDPDGDDQGQLSIDIEYDTRYRGQVQIGYGSGYAPGTVVQGFMNSTPTIDLGTQVADANGEVTFRWTIPASAAIDTHTFSLEADGYDTQSVSFRVLADVSAGGSGGSGSGSGSGSGRLPSTGADTTLLGAAALLLLAGGAVALGSARIRRRSSSEV